MAREDGTGVRWRPGLGVEYENDRSGVHELENAASGGRSRVGGTGMGMKPDAAQGGPIIGAIRQEQQHVPPDGGLGLATQGPPDQKGLRRPGTPGGCSRREERRLAKHHRRDLSSHRC